MKKSIHHIDWFSFVELIVATTIVIILSSMGFYAYSQYLIDARDSQRASDFASVSSSLKVYRQKRGAYPLPGDRFWLKNGATLVVARQWKLNKSVSLDTLDKLPTDPYSKTFYSYSVTANRQEFQLAWTLENAGRPTALLQGTYKTVTKNNLPSIVIAYSSTTDLDITNATYKNTFILNNGTHNIPYSHDTGIPVSDGTVFASLLLDPTIDFWQNTDYTSCAAIYYAWKNIWAWEYQILDTNGNLINTTCLASY